MAKQTINLTGGARIGRTNASFPEATLQVSSSSLKLNVSLIGNFEFQSKDIISIEPYTLIPLLGQGIKINHRISDYNSKIIFWSTKNPNHILNLIKGTGFLDNISKNLTKEDLIILQKQKQEEFPISPTVFIVLFFIYFGLFVNSFLIFPFKNGGFEILQRAVIIFCSVILASCFLVIISNKLQKLILLKDREYSEIKKGVGYTIVATGLILLAFLLY